MAGIPPDIITSALQGHQASRQASSVKRSEQEARTQRLEKIRKQILEDEHHVQQSDQTEDQQMRVHDEEHERRSKKGAGHFPPGNPADSGSRDEPEHLDIQA